MSGYARVLLATDLTDATRPAAARAAAIAAASGALPVMLHVMEFLEPETDTDTDTDAATDTTRERLAQLADEVGLADAEQVVIASEASAHGVILDYAEHHGFELIVVGALGNPGALGLTVDNVAARASCDVLIVWGRGWKPPR